MRVSKSFNPVIDATNEIDSYITIDYHKKSYKIRLIKVELKTGETELLLTNIDENDFKYEEFAELYYKRWPVETKYDTVKHKNLKYKYHTNEKILIGELKNELVLAMISQNPNKRVEI